MKDLHCYLLALALVICTGCPNPAAPPPPSSSTTAPLRVMVVDDAPLGAAISREWLAHTESKLELIDVTSEKAASAAQLPVDVVIYPTALLGQLATRDFLLPLDETMLSEPTYARDEILPVFRAAETTWGRRTLAVPLGSPQFALWYRADLLAELKLDPPKTWQDYEMIAAKLAEKPADLKPAVDYWQATVEPLADGWAGRLLLARAAASALHRDQLSPLWDLEKLEPLIASPPFVQALEALVKDNAHDAPGPPGNELADRKLLTPEQCCEKFQAGECALAIGWPGVTAETVAPKLQSEQIGVTMLPGSREMFHPKTQQWEPVNEAEPLHVPLVGLSGRVASVTRASAQPQTATRFILWLSGPKVSGRIAPVSSATTVFRTSHFRSDGTWQAPATIKSQLPAYGEVLFALPAAGRRFDMPRIPGEHEYLAALDAAVLKALRKELPPAEALQQAADQWRAINKERGVTVQQRALRRSLGLGD
jgi:multiple sugar transport system substrate-binding protein